ncbi:hypothetical protein [Gymnodinialimonas sp. 57CJ19]|uniref:hypothetical protein n=1 Tax=Gymnodinialimonas sp. 57CJ19 TaxID=3138498 RepID=UPI00313454CF
MKRTFPLLAVMAATLAAPVAAQDINSILNPGNFAARLNMGNAPAMANMPRDMSALFDGRAMGAAVNPALANQIAALAPETRSLAPRTSMAPVPRRSIARIVTPDAAPEVAALRVAPVAEPEADTGLVAMMADAANAAPAGSNTFVVNGTNTAVIQSSPSAEAPRLSLWQRLFGS